MVEYHVPMTDDNGAILVLDDDVAIAEVLANFLRNRGHGVFVAHTGQAGLAVLTDRDIALVLLDLQLPDVCGGVVMAEARKRDSPPEIVIITGHADLDSAVQALDAGAGGYLVKPIDLGRLAAIVDRILERRRLRKDNNRLTGELNARLRETEALLGIASSISSTLDVREAMRRICRELTRLTGADTGAVYLHEPATDHLVAFAGYHVPPELLQSFLLTPLPLREQGFYLPLWQERRPVFTDDVAADARLTHEIFRRHPHQSGLLLPLMLDSEVAGAIYLVWWKERRRFAPRDLALAESVVGQTSVLLRNAQLFERAERQRQMVTELTRAQASLAKTTERLKILHEIDRALIAAEAPVTIAASVVVPLRELLGVARVIVNVFDIARGEVEWLAAAGRRRIHRGPGIKYPLAFAGDLDALRRGEPQVVGVESLPEGPEATALLASGIRVYVVVPMIAGGELIGSVSFGDPTGPFSPEKISIAQEAATQLAIALVQARLHERVKRQAEELEERVQERTLELRMANEHLQLEIAERRRAEEAAAAANRLKGEFVANMSHELRTPLNAIIGFAELLHDRKLGSISDQQREFMGDILTSARHLLSLINGVLDLSKVEAGKMEFFPEPVDVASIVGEVRDALRSLTARKRLQVETAIDPSVSRVVADPAKLRQVLYNYVANAVKFTPEGGRVTVRVMPDGARHFRLEVEDTGIGIKPEDIGRLFGAFQQLDASRTKKYQGTGLGLALTKRVVEAQGGRVGVRSRFGEGSTFFAVLPRFAPTGERDGAAPSRATDRHAEGGGGSGP